MKIKLVILVSLVTGFLSAQNNLLDTSTWTEGTGSVSGFGRTGDDEESVRGVGINPFGDSSILWEAVPDNQSNGDGGWTTSFLDADHTKTYQFSIWLKKTNSNDGNTYFGPYTYDDGSSRVTYKLNGTTTTNPAVRSVCSSSAKFVTS